MVMDAKREATPRYGGVARQATTFREMGYFCRTIWMNQFRMDRVRHHG